jgi:hypothetical protein
MTRFVSKLTPAEQTRILLSSENSRCNKMHLAAAWGVEWRWEDPDHQPTPNGVMSSRMLFLIDGEWRRARSWDEDVRPKLRGREEERA